MITDNWLNDVGGLLDTLLPDFVLGFAFFTSITYAVLAKRFDHQRSAIAAAASIGFALATGLVWWEQANDISIRNLGPIAVGFAILVLAFVMYVCIKNIGGSWAGAGITLGVCIIISQILGLGIPFDKEILQSITTAALVIGIFAFLMHTHSHTSSIPARSIQYPKKPKKTVDMTRLFRQRHLADDLTNKIKKTRKIANNLTEHPEDAGDVLVQIKRILPEQGYLTKRMAELRKKAHRVRNGHIARLQETRSAFKKLPASLKKKASEKLISRYKQLVGIDKRIERLDNSVAQTEKRIRELILRAGRYTQDYDFPKLADCLKQAQKLQKHNAHLFKLIERTERKLSSTVHQIKREVKQNGR
jgi:hypothetical protein